MPRVLHAATVVGVSLTYLFYVFDIFHQTFWAAGLGDWIDPYFINYLLEHWYYAITTFANPSSPPMFYPAANTLGYSHSLLLYAPFYLVVRVFFHPFQAYSLALLLIIETGIVCLYVILRRFMRLSFGEAALLTVFFFTSSNVINGTIGVWSQRASVFLIPPILLLMLISFHQRPGGLRLTAAAVSGFLATLLLPHDFYSGFFTVFFATLFLVAWVVVEGQPSALVRVFTAVSLRVSELFALAAVVTTIAWTIFLSTSGGVRGRVLGVRITSEDWRRPAAGALIATALFVWMRRPSTIKADLRTIAVRITSMADPWGRAVLAGAVAGFGVFLWLYLPAFREHPQFPEKDLLDQIRVHSWTRWTTALRDLSAYATVRSFKTVGICAVLAWVPWAGVDAKTRRYLLFACLVSVVVFLMPIRVDGFSIWLSGLRYVPGFSVIRDPTRVIFECELAFIFMMALLLVRVSHRRAFRSVVCVLLLYFLATDVRFNKLAYERPNETFSRYVDAPLDVDPACRSFYVKGASPKYMSRSSNIPALYGGDAMFIALRTGLPTLNGYSAWAPGGWELANPQEAIYPNRVREWIAKNHLRNVCELDIEARTMRVAALN